MKNGLIKKKKTYITYAWLLNWLASTEIKIFFT